MEKGIDPEADYGQQFLNAGGRSGASTPPPPAPPTGDDAEPTRSGRSAGQIALIAIAVLAVVGGAVAFVALGGGGGGDNDDDDLITAQGVQIDEEGRPVRTTTEAPETTTTEAPETTTTEAPTTTVPTTVAPLTSTTVAGFPPPGGVPGPTVAPLPTLPPTVAPTRPPCPGGSVANNLTGATVTIVGGSWKVDVSGSTTNSTTAAITLQVTVPISYVDATGATKTVTARPQQYGQTIPAGGTLSWSVSQPIDSDQQPRPGSPVGAFSWADPNLASCPTGA